jgi:hypothetical protein
MLSLVSKLRKFDVVGASPLGKTNVDAVPVFLKYATSFDCDPMMQSLSPSASKSAQKGAV